MHLDVDLHTHTIASGHAYSTLRENITVAKKRGLRIFGTSDHSKDMKGVGTNAAFANFRGIPRFIEGIPVLCGVEANVRDVFGRIDIDLNLRPVDYAIVSLHKQCIAPSDEKGNTDALIKACTHPAIKIIGHPDDDRYPLDYERLSDFITGKSLFCEVNNSSLKPHGPRSGAEKNLETLLKFGKKKGMRVIVGSDAHMDVDVGNFDLAESLLIRMDYPEELIVNTWDTEAILAEFPLMDK
ncbi:Probable phosphatase YcdX [Aedoeadaptatus ivorii]|uniref:Probable phosphatase YcdX n=1 Tax=Aedoeadaptatus ivorii TaxID=54006 RepID=A0A448V324_9FIRM|nr:PHP domain-containing protein [Peptoniphilus ivorii]MDQ0508675.1 putative hydrolase [Peptoniphilus ivorii]VEJ36198.1 Probable phosphatase YcdX [Peptoniphilus ivorii]